MLNLSTMPSVGRLAVVASSLLSLANAHMYLAEPKPMAGNAIKDPLDPSGSNFPCHGADLSATGGQKISAGGSFPLKFDLGPDGYNTAVHGGGSCQISMTYETDPVKVKDPKNWVVVKSIIGGCPANTAANLDTVTPANPNGKATYCLKDDSGDCVHSWDITMPKGVKAGDATLAMTWQNTLGNREFYMTCASVHIEGGTGDEMDSFPAMFVANLEIEGGKCPTTASQDVIYPNPGKYVTTMSATDGKNWPKAIPTGDGCAAGGSAAQPTGYGSGSGSSGAAPSSSYAAPSSSYAAPSQAAPTSIASQISSGIASYDNQKGRQTQTTFATSVAVTQSAVASSAVASSAVASSAAPAPTGYSGSSNSENGNETSGSASSTEGCVPGSVGCQGPSKFGLYQQDCSIVYQDVSSGMACLNGAIVGAAPGRFRRHLHGAHKH